MVSKVSSMDPKAISFHTLIPTDADSLLIRSNMKKVIEISKRDDIPTYIAADRMAEERIAKIRGLEILSTIDGSKIRAGR